MNDLATLLRFEQGTQYEFFLHVPEKYKSYILNEYNGFRTKDDEVNFVNNLTYHGEILSGFALKSRAGLFSRTILEFKGKFYDLQITEFCKQVKFKIIMFDENQLEIYMNEFQKDYATAFEEPTKNQSIKFISLPFEQSIN